MSNLSMGSGTSSSLPFTSVITAQRIIRHVRHGTGGEALTVLEAVSLDDLFCLIDDVRHIDLYAGV